jgi:hypothetical protein
VYELLCPIAKDCPMALPAEVSLASLAPPTPVPGPTRLLSVGIPPRAMGLSSSTSELLDSGDFDGGRRPNDLPESPPLPNSDNIASVFDPDRPGCITYHWATIGVSSLLAQARAYEKAYQTLLKGRVAEAQGIIRAQPNPDKSWQALAEQAEKQATATAAWDGVFYFKEK